MLQLCYQAHLCEGVQHVEAVEGARQPMDSALWLLAVARPRRAVQMMAKDPGKLMHFECWFKLEWCYSIAGYEQLTCCVLGC